MVGTVVQLGAECEVVPPDRMTASPGSACFDVSEFAVLSDGRRITLHRERGFGVSRGAADDPWTFLTAESIEADVRTTVLPDEDPAQDDHPYEWLCELLRQQGVGATVEQLRAVPYVVELSPTVRHCLAAGTYVAGDRR